MSNFITCPTCHYTRQSTDDAPDWECPKCQKAYIKTARAMERQASAVGIQPVSFAAPLQATNTFNGEGLQRANRRNPFDPNNPEEYVRENFSSIDQWYRQFESLFDASVFGDSVAMQTKWTTAAFYATAERYNRELVEVALGRFEFRAASGMKLFGLFFIFAGFVGAIANSSKHLSTGKTVGLLLICAAFVIAGITLLLKSSRPIVFDLQLGFFWRGKKSPNDLISQQTTKDAVRIQDIHGLQLIFWGGVVNTADGRGGTRNYRYELNLVLNDGNRINVAVATYYNRERLQADAATLARTLGKPLWNAIDAMFSLYEKMRTQAAYDQYFGEQQ